MSPTVGSAAPPGLAGLDHNSTSWASQVSCLFRTHRLTQGSPGLHRAVSASQAGHWKVMPQGNVARPSTALAHPLPYEHLKLQIRF